MALTEAKVKLVGEDGNAFNLMAIVIRALKKVGRKDLVDSFKKEAMAGDYNQLLVTCMDYVEVS